MKKLIMLIMLALPLIGCAGFTDHITPVIGGIPEEALTYSGETNAPPKPWYLFKVFNSKAQLKDTNVAVINKREWNILDRKQEAERDDVRFEQAGNKVLDRMKEANAIQDRAIDPIATAVGGLATGGLGLLLGRNLLSKPGDVSPEVHDAKVNEAKATPPTAT